MSTATEPGRPDVDVLVPTCGRPAALAVTLAGLVGQRHPPRRVVVSDQGEEPGALASREVMSAVLVLRHRGVVVELHRHLPRRGLAEHRQFLLDRAESRFALFLDDDVLLEPDVVERLVDALDREGCGFVGAFVNAPSAVCSDKPIDALPPDLVFEPWVDGVQPELVAPGSPLWGRHRMHFAAYQHLACERLGVSRERPMLYKVAWVGGCVLFDVAKLRAVGGFSFWTELPAVHCGEDVVAQLRVMARYGGAALAPSGAWHLEVPTTCADRQADAPHLLPPAGPPPAESASAASP